MKIEAIKTNYVSAAITAYLSPVSGLLISLFAFVLLDWITGMWAAIKLRQPITSTKLRRTLSKIVVYAAAVLASIVFEKEILFFAIETISKVFDLGLTPESLPIVKILALYIGATELQSILENLNKIYKLPFLKVIIEKLQPLNDATTYQNKVAEEIDKIKIPDIMEPKVPKVKRQRAKKESPHKHEINKEYEEQHIKVGPKRPKLTNRRLSK